MALKTLGRPTEAGKGMHAGAAAWQGAPAWIFRSAQVDTVRRRWPTVAARRDPWNGPLCRWDSCKPFRMRPDVPTIAEAGVPGFALDVWMGLTMSAKVP